MAVVAIAFGAYLLVPPLCAGALLDGVVEVEPPAPAGAGLLDDGLVAGVLAGVGLFGMLDPTPVVCDFGMRACAIRVCCCLPSRAVRVIRCCLLTCAVRICGMLDPEAAVCVPSMRLTRASFVLRGSPFCCSKRFSATRVWRSILPLTLPFNRPSDFRRS